MANDSAMRTAPAIVPKATGIEKVHLTMPSELKNTDMSGLMIRQLTIIPITVERIIAGIKDSAV